MGRTDDQYVAFLAQKREKYRMEKEAKAAAEEAAKLKTAKRSLAAFNRRNPHRKKVLSDYYVAPMVSSCFVFCFCWIAPRSDGDMRRIARHLCFCQERQQVFASSSIDSPISLLYQRSTRYSTVANAFLLLSFSLLYRQW